MSERQQQHEQQQPMHFYNDNDPFCCRWLGELTKAGHLPAGTINNCSITDIQPHELAHYTQCHFFAGIGGWPYALRLAEWPDDQPVWTGSCPCQPFSCAGKGAGEHDPRHLWPQMRRLIALCHPPTIFGEQVASAAGRVWLLGVRADLEALGYAVGASDLCAAGVGAPHIRQRLYWVAHSWCNGRRTWAASEPGYQSRTALSDNRSDTGGMANNGGARLEIRCQQPAREECAAVERGGEAGGVGNAERTGRESRCEPTDQSASCPVQASNSRPWDAYDLLPCRDGKARRVEPGTFPLAHGVPGRVGLLRGYGNAIVPQLAAEFIAAAMEAMADGTQQQP